MYHNVMVNQSQINVCMFGKHIFPSDFIHRWLLTSYTIQEKWNDNQNNAFI